MLLSALRFHVAEGFAAFDMVETFFASEASAYDAAGRRRMESDALGNATWFSYNPDGSLAATTNAFGEVWQFASDVGGGCCGASGLTATMTDPLGRQTTELHSPEGLPLGTVRRSGTNVAATSITYQNGLPPPPYPLKKVKLF